MITVFLADDHQMFREGLRTLVEKTDGIKVIGEAGEGHETLKKIEKLKPDIALVDISIPGLNGIELTKRIKKQLPDTKVFIVSMHADNFLAIDALKAGAMGYLLKEESFTLLVEAIRIVCGGKIFLSPTMETPVLKEFVRQTRRSADHRGQVLTERETEVLQLIAEEMTSQEVAERLCISTGTVDTHRKNIMSKLDIHSVAGLVKYAIKHRIVTV